ncbi:MAG TPA: glycoside hydrolase family 71/99-like protein [Verrucomicrobiae bacterium]|jgi:hypothetical protein
MKRIRIQLVVFALLGLSWSWEAAAKPLLVYYMPWYVAKPYSPNWGWHWTMNHFDPDTINAAGERQIASWYYPLIGPYDSADPAVLEYHVLLMKLSGIDGIIVDWYGPDEYLDYGVNNQRTAAIFQYARRAGLKFCLCYEDQTIQQEISGGYIAASNALTHAQQTMLYVQTNYFADASYLRWNDHPVLLNFGPQYFKTNAQWQTIFSVLTNPPAFFTEDNRVAAGVGAFDWPPMWLSQAPGTEGVLSGAALEGYLSSFQQNGSAWPAFISSGFPRFHDIYQQAGVRDYWGYLGDKQGDILRATLGRALTNNSAMAQVVTWNDFGEGTMVEPTVEYGYRDLQIIQEHRRLYMDSNFSYRTNDLELAGRLFNLRCRFSTNNAVKPKLDAVFNAVVANDLPAARKQLAEFDSK